MEKFSPAEKQRAQRSGELERMAAERIKHLERRNENGERKREAVEAAREKLKHAETASAKTEKSTKDEGVAKRPLLTKAVSYRNTMASLRHRMSPTSRTFSRFIHTPVVENTSEVLGKTVLRPSVTLGATMAGVIIGGSIYIYARTQGFVPPGSVIWISLLVGAVMGLLVEALYKSVRRLKQR